MPYAPSWYDRLSAWVDRLPGPEWLFYVTLAVLLALADNLLRWLNGKQPPGGVDPTASFYAVLLPFTLWYLKFLDRVADESLRAFRPLLQLNDAEFERLRYELTNLPARVTVIGTVLAVLLTIPIMLLYPLDAMQLYAETRQDALMYYAWLHAGVYVAAFIGLYHAIHQLGVVRRIHAMPAHVSLLQTGPLYAFSRLTALTGAGYIAVAYYAVALRPDLTLGNPAIVALGVCLVAIGVACFILPLYGIHRRIVIEKDRLQGEANRRFEATIADLHRRVDENKLERMDDLNKAMASLQIERDALAKLSTWPWQPGTLAGFVSALVIPVVLWFILRVLEKLI